MRFNIENENYKYLRESKTSFENNVPILTVTEKVWQISILISDTEMKDYRRR